MTAFTGTAMYVIIWWVTLLAMLPVFTRPVSAPDPSSGWRGAPERLRMGRVLLATTLVSAVIWAGVDVVISSDWISFRSGPWALPND